MNYVYAMGGDLCAIGGWTVTINGTQKFGGYLVNVYTLAGSTWKIRPSVTRLQLEIGECLTEYVLSVSPLGR